MKFVILFDIMVILIAVYVIISSSLHGKYLREMTSVFIEYILSKYDEHIWDIIKLINLENIILMYYKKIITILIIFKKVIYIQ